jgi:hypothetical protein
MSSKTNNYNLLCPRTNLYPLLYLAPAKTLKPTPAASNFSRPNRNSARCVLKRAYFGSSHRVSDCWTLPSALRRTFTLFIEPGEIIEVSSVDYSQLKWAHHSFSLGAFYLRHSTEETAPRRRALPFLQIGPLQALLKQRLKSFARKMRAS